MFHQLNTIGRELSRTLLVTIACSAFRTRMSACIHNVKRHPFIIQGKGAFCSETRTKWQKLVENWASASSISSAQFIGVRTQRDNQLTLPGTRLSLDRIAWMPGGGVPGSTASNRVYQFVQITIPSLRHALFTGTNAGTGSGLICAAPSFQKLANSFRSAVR